ncbi:hypothetical protein BDV98DRAFT_571965 [Pterulicium gracile]|uniref:ATPase AAA-type core domain-containing protein n=1 Tax=Pterulicium gracile TaxID=1884261 RepID=A0A5C3QFL2_9AGAR|nr:hypothetical protein BDV98DRAFT_571965 [Pterula gracilis]
MLDCIFSWIMDRPMKSSNNLAPIDRQFLCVLGYPGSGKPTIAVAIAERLACFGRNIFCANYFIQRGHSVDN